MELRYLQLLSDKFPNAPAVAKEIILLESVLNLPKGAELFLSDVHGEHESFRHVLKNASGIVRSKIIDLFSDELNEKEIRAFASLIYYPEHKIEIIKNELENAEEFYAQTLYRLVRLSREFASIYANRKIQKLLPEDYGYIISELTQERERLSNQKDYYHQIIKTVIEIDQADRLIVAFANFIQKLAVHKIHIIGDIFDRGPGAEHIMDALMDYQSVDVQWGNHDIAWMGAACGSRACIANVLRLSLRYGNTDTLEKGYGINLMPLVSFAIEVYKNDESLVFEPKSSAEDAFNESEQWLNRIMHKAISIIQFKLEGQLAQRCPEFGVGDRDVLSKIDYRKSTVAIEGTEYDLNDGFFPTINPASPNELSESESALLQKLWESFRDSERLQRHTRFLYENGGMYKVSNQSLLYHGCIPIDDSGNLEEVEFEGKLLKGRALLDYFDQMARKAYFGKRKSVEKEFGRDIMWYLWAGSKSPLFGKHKMATFERYFLSDEKPKAEHKNGYYKFRDNEATCKMILSEFGLDPDKSRIINGHVPVVVKKGESPIKANGKLIVIDGGFSKAYQTQTGIAGYTLIHNELGLQLVSHEPFESTKSAITKETDIVSSQTILSKLDEKLCVRDTNDGIRVLSKITELKSLLDCFQKGTIKERYFGNT
ncbi:fructose-1,6-bisphosphatase [Reichenbachiella sp. MALMAid0571]|uniref:fructose-1,6-bisphosphatase n=1 Tax=Reichenbachiella sp. MALMAid0571 TaxID=3143939 RepID=UPI0032DE839E